MVHKPKHKVHSFRGLLGDGGQDEITLSRQDNSIAYRIVKFEIIGEKPGDVDLEAIVKVYLEKQTSIDEVINFTDQDLIAAAYWKEDAAAGGRSFTQQFVFSNELFSRDIYVTHKDKSTSEYCNYYIEIEEVPVGAATLMQLKLATARKLIGAKMGA